MAKKKKETPVTATGSDYWSIFQNGTKNIVSSIAGEVKEGLDAVVNDYSNFEIGELLTGYQEISAEDVELAKEGLEAYVENSRNFRRMCKIKSKRAREVAANQVAFRAYQAELAEAQVEMQAANVSLAVGNTRLLAPKTRMALSLDKAKVAAQSQISRILEPAEEDD